MTDDIYVGIALWFGFFMAFLPFAIGTRHFKVKGLLFACLTFAFSAAIISLLLSYKSDCELVKVYLLQQKCAVPLLIRPGWVGAMHLMSLLMFSLIAPVVIRDAYLAARSKSNKRL